MSPERAKYNEQGIRDVSSSTRDLSYTKDLKEIIERNPHAIKTVTELIGQIQEQFGRKVVEAGPTQKPVFLEKDGIKVTLERIPNKPADFFKVDIENKSFFVKKSGIDSGWGGGVEEMNSLRSVEDELRGLEKVSIVPYKLGFSDKKGNRYYVSEWLDHLGLYQHLYRLRAKPEGIRLKKRSVELEHKLVGRYRDVGPGNMFYDPENDVIYIYDITLI